MSHRADRGTADDAAMSQYPAAAEWARRQLDGEPGAPRLILPRDPVAAACAELIESARATIDAWHNPGPGARTLAAALARQSVAVNAIDHLAEADAALITGPAVDRPPVR